MSESYDGKILEAELQRIEEKKKYDAQIAALQSENEQLRKALEFYASEDSYTKVDVWNTPIMIDAGEIARAAIRKTQRMK